MYILYKFKSDPWLSLNFLTMLQSMLLSSKPQVAWPALWVSGYSAGSSSRALSARCESTARLCNRWVTRPIPVFPARSWWMLGLALKTTQTPVKTQPTHPSTYAQTHPFCFCYTPIFYKLSGWLRRCRNVVSHAVALVSVCDDGV